MPLKKPWQPYDPAESAKLPGALGVYELADEAGRVLYIGFAGGKSRYGLRSEITKHFAGESGNAQTARSRSYRYEVNQMYLTRWVELLERHRDGEGAGALPPGNLEPGEYMVTLGHAKTTRAGANGSEGT
jgi:hypothetical protein